MARPWIAPGYARVAIDTVAAAAVGGKRDIHDSGHSLSDGIYWTLGKHHLTARTGGGGFLLQLPAGQVPPKKLLSAVNYGTK